MMENKKKLRQQRKLWLVFELCGSLQLPCHVALSAISLGHITADKRFGSCRASNKLCLRENFFYPRNVINKTKLQERQEKIQLINASKLFKKGKPKNFLPDESIKQIADSYLNWKEVESISKIITNEEAAQNDYNLSPSRYVAQNGEDDTLPLEDAVVQLQEAEEERQKAD